MSKESLLGLSLKKKEIKLGDEKYIVKEMNAKDAGRYENSLYKIIGDKVIPNAENAKSKLVLYTLYDLEDKRVFEDNDIAHIQNLPASVVDKVFQIANGLNGLDKETVEKN